MEIDKKNAHFGSRRGLFLALVIPVFLLYYFSLTYLSSLNRQVRQRNFESESDLRLNLLKNAANTEEFLCRRLQNISIEAQNPEDMQGRLVNFFQKSGIELKYCLWNADGDVFFANLDNINQVDLKKVFADLVSLREDRNSIASEFESFNDDSELAEFDNSSIEATDESLQPEPRQNEAAVQEADEDAQSQDLTDYRSSEEKEALYRGLKKTLGSEFNPVFYHRCYEGKKLRLNRTSVDDSAPLIWLKIGENFGALIYFDPADLQLRLGLQEYLADNKDDQSMIVGYHDGKSAYSNRSFSLPKELDFSISRFSAERFGNYYLKSNHIAHNLTGFALIPAQEIDGAFFGRELRGGNLLLLLVPAFFMIISILFLMPKKKFFFSIKLQFALIFIAANLLTGMVISIIVKDYLTSYQKSLEQKSANESIEILKSCDDLFLNELTLQKIRLEKKLLQTRKALASGRIIDEQLVRSLLKGMKPFPARMYLVGSDSATMGTEDGVISKHDIIADFTGKLKALPVVLKFIRIMKDVGHYYLDKINQEEVSFRKAYRLEAIIESLSKQKPVEQLLQFFEQDSDFWHWGFWSHVYPSYIKTFRTNPGKKYDYTFLYLWFNFDLQKHYLERSLQNLSKNDLGLKLFAVDNKFSLSLPENHAEPIAPEKFARLIQANEDGKAARITFDGQECFFVSIPGTRMADFHLIGILPTEKILRKVETARDFLKKVFLACLLVSIFLAILIARSVSEPLFQLELGANAISERAFKFRLPDLGKNEFGKLGNVLNDLLNDYQEVYNAAIVREKLLDTCPEPEKLPGFTMVSRSFSVSDSCPDFFHICRDEGQPRGFLLGTAGQLGVAANLILGFTRGALIQFDCEKASLQDYLPMLQGLFQKSNHIQSHCKSISMLQVIVEDDGLGLRIANAGLQCAFIWKHGRLEKFYLKSGMPIGDDQFSLFPEENRRLEKDEMLIFFSNGIDPEDEFYQTRAELESLLTKASGEVELAALVIGYFESRFRQNLLAKDLSVVVIQPRI
jgi:hypothetical protein